MKMPSATVRLWIYNVLNAATLVAVGYGVMTGEEAALWGLLINAALGLASANVPTLPNPRHTAPEVTP